MFSYIMKLKFQMTIPARMISLEEECTLGLNKINNPNVANTSTEVDTTSTEFNPVFMDLSWLQFTRYELQYSNIHGQHRLYIYNTISQSLRCRSHFLDKRLLLTRKLLYQGFQIVKLKSSLRKIMDPSPWGFMFVTNLITKLTVEYQSAILLGLRKRRKHMLSVLI